MGKDRQLFLATSSGYKALGEAIKFTDDVVKKLNYGEAFIEFDTVVILADDKTPTRNGVIYPKAKLDEAIKRPRLLQLLNTGVFYGEKEHPEDPEDLMRWTKVDRKNTHFKFIKFWWDGDNLMGRVRTTDENGNDMVKAIRSGELPSFSIRVIGKPEQKGDVVVLDDIHLIAVDWVTYPGNPQSHVVSSDAFELVDSPLKNGYRFPLVASGESSLILKEMGITGEIYSNGKGLFMTGKPDTSFKASMESVRKRNLMRHKAL